MQETLTTLGIGEALVTVLGENGAPSPPFVARIAPPASRMGPLTPAEIAPLLQTEQVRRYAAAVDRESAYEILGAAPRAGRRPRGGARPHARRASKPAAPAKKTESAWTEALRSPVARTIANQVTRGLMGALLGPPPPPPAHAQRVVSANAARSQGLPSPRPSPASGRGRQNLVPSPREAAAWVEG